MTRSLLSAPIATAILAGGRAQRFGGQPKGLAPFGDSTVVETQIDSLASVASPFAIVGDNLEPFGGLSTAVVRLGDRRPSCGPLGGIAAGLEWSPTDWLFVVAGDMPLVSGDVVKALAREAKGGVALVAPIIGDRVQPLAALYHKSSLGEFDSCLSTGRLSPRRFYSARSGLSFALVPFENALATQVAGFNDHHELEICERARR